MEFKSPFKRHRVLLAIAASATLILAGCSASDTARQADIGSGQLTEITIAEQSKGGLSTGALPHLADELGYFEDEGLEVSEYIVVTKGADAISGMMSGEVQFSHIGADGFIAAAQGGDVVGLAANIDASFWTVVSNPEITDWSDLKGKTIALGSTGDITRAVFDQLASQAGLDPDKDLEYVALGATPQRVAAVQQGQAAATIAAYAAAGRVIDDGLKDLGFAVEGHEPPQMMTTDIEASRSWVEAHPDETVAYLRAIKRAMDFAKDSANSQTVAEIISSISEEPIEHILQGLDKYYVNPPSDAFFPEDFRHLPGAFDATVKAYKELGLFSGEITEDEYMDYSYADEALGK